MSKLFINTKLPFLVGKAGGMVSIVSIVSKAKGYGRYLVWIRGPFINSRCRRLETW